jgi:lipopolysaccharide/colanic/teichoic acid biosynthesis glycosyltransferase
LRISCALLLIALMLLLASATFAWADSDPPHAVPEVSAAVLAPLGIGAVIAVERRRRRLAAVRRGVGTAYFVTKRSLDFCLSACLLIALAPIFALIALLVRLSGPGAIVFKRRVIGRNGVSFDMLKFRSMVMGAEEMLAEDEELKRVYLVNCKLETDPRVTSVGKVLRRTSLDELPQLINVFLGHMTFVGPRPIHADEVAIYGPEVERFKTVTPGITGLWQTRGRSNTSYEDRVRMDMQYIEQRSVLLDLWILAYTIPAVVLRRGAC